MNGVIDSQTSRNDWSASQSMLHERIEQPMRVVLNPYHQDPILARLEQQMVEAESEFSHLTAQLASDYVFRNPQDVKAFLRSHRGTPSIIREATPYLHEAFGDVPFLLDVATEEGAPRTMSVLALWKADRMTARQALRTFDNRWWLDNLSKAGGKIVFDYELV